MASPESAPSTPPSNPDSGAPPESSNNNNNSSTTPNSPPPAPSTSPPPSPPQSPPPAPQKSPPPSSPPPSSPPPSSPSPPPPSESTTSPPPEDDSGSSSSPPPPPSSPDPSPPPAEKGSPPSPPPAPAAKSGSPPPTSPPPPTAAAVSPPPGNDSQPSPAVFSPPPSGAIASSTPPPPSEKAAPLPPSNPSSSPSRPSPSPPPSRPSSRNNSPSDSGSTSSSSSRPTPSSSSTDNTALIVGVILGGILIVAVVSVCIFCRMKKKRRQRYYLDTARPPKPGDTYYTGTTPAQWNTPQGMDHVVKLPPPPGGMGGAPSPVVGVGPGGWGPPSTTHYINSSAEFSSGYSGQHHNSHMTPQSPNVTGLGFSKSQFTFEELAEATSGFSQANLLGQGGFGFVHKGVLPDGKEVAVKSLKSGSGQGEREFQAEVEIISRVHHRHLVSLVGYCIADGQRMLVYEFVSNKTLEFHLHGKGQPVMNFETRLQIALGSARGLAYLHEDCHPRIIHRDIKAANILLDDNYEAMVADFGLAKLSSDNYTHVSTRVMGTFGYLAPEYASSGKLTDKSDVFSFGVMLLELITGRKPVDPSGTFMEDSLVDWARPLLTQALEDGNFNELVDPRLEGNFVTHEMTRMIACAAASIRHSARRRPKMGQIVRALEGDSSLEDLNGGQKAVNPGGPGGGGVTGSVTQTYDTGMYNADMQKFRKMVMSPDQEFNSSEYGDTSDYGLHPSASSSDEFGRGSSGRQPKP